MQPRYWNVCRTDHGTQVLVVNVYDDHVLAALHLDRELFLCPNPGWVQWVTLDCLINGVTLDC